MVQLYYTYCHVVNRSTRYRYCTVPYPDELVDDKVQSEVKLWAALDLSRVKKHTGAEGLVNELALIFELKPDFPLHFSVFKQVSSHRPHEGNAETTFSLSGRLSSPNTHTSSSYLSILVRINKNKVSKNPLANEILPAYKRKYHKLPILGDDVSVMSRTMRRVTRKRMMKKNLI